MTARDLALTFTLAGVLLFAAGVALAVGASTPAVLIGAGVVVSAAGLVGVDIERSR